MKRILILSLILCTMSSAAFAENIPAEQTAVKAETPAAPVPEAKKTDSGNAFGITAGFVTGVGMSYLHYPEIWGVKATFIPIIDSEGEAWVNGGFCAMRTFYTQNYFRLFWFAGASLWYDRSEIYDYEYYNDSTHYYMRSEFRGDLTTGPGVLLKVENLGFEVMSGYGFYIKKKESGYSWFSNLTIETSAYFFF